MTCSEALISKGYTIEKLICCTMSDIINKLIQAKGDITALVKSLTCTHN